MKGKQMRKAFCACLLSAVVCFSYAEIPLAESTDAEAAMEDFDYSIMEDNTAEITKYYGTEEILTLPETIDGHSVTSIGEKAFWSCDSLTEVTIPDGVTVIGNEAFKYCGNLTEISIPDSVTSIGDEAFTECESLTEISIPDNVDSIGENPFSYCPLISVSVSEEHSLLEIVDGVLFDKQNKCLVYYPLSEEASTYEIPEGTCEIGASAFSGCKSLTEISIPDSVVVIGDSAFYYCENLKEITIPDSVTSIGEWAFYACTGLNELAIPGSVASIGDAAFLTSLGGGYGAYWGIEEDAENIPLVVEEGSFAEEYAQNNQLEYTYK